MRIEDNSEKKIDINLFEVINILNKNHIKYWICHGTLLGVIRDKQLIPWDHDIDIAVWLETNSKKKITDIMISNNFVLKEKYLLEDDLLTFIKKGGREVDINFYQTTVEKRNNKKIAYVNWHIPRNFFCKLIDALSIAKRYEGRLKYVIKLFGFFEAIFKKIKLLLIKKNLFYRSAGYTQPLDLLKEFKNISFYDVNLVIPKKSEEYLTYVYGNNWKIPKKKYNWIKDSPSTIKI